MAEVGVIGAGLFPHAVPLPDQPASRPPMEAGCFARQGTSTEPFLAKRVGVGPGLRRRCPGHSGELWLDHVSQDTQSAGQVGLSRVRQALSGLGKIALGCLELAGVGDEILVSNGHLFEIQAIRYSEWIYHR